MFPEITAFFFLPPSEADSLENTALQMLMFYERLAIEAAMEGQTLWSIVPKHHFFLHLSSFGRFYHPSQGWTFAGEDFVGRFSKITRSATYGLGPVHLGAKLMNRALLCIQIRLERRTGRDFIEF